MVPALNQAEGNSTQLNSTQLNSMMSCAEQRAAWAWWAMGFRVALVPYGVGRSSRIISSVVKLGHSKVRHDDPLAARNVIL